MATAIKTIGAAEARATGTIQDSWRWLRFNVESGDTDPMATVTNFDFGNKSAALTGNALSDFTALVSVPVSGVGNFCEVIFMGDDAANEAADYVLYAYSASGPPRRVSSGTATLGTARCQTLPTASPTSARIDGDAYEGITTPSTIAATAFYADTITTNDEWDGVVVNDSGNNRVASIGFDLRGYQWLAMVFPTLTSVAGISAVYRLY
tara:strand:- start:298 stop:921 length:624 start_codon:yes stop_codon:yes gene_type:complete